MIIAIVILSIVCCFLIYKLQQKKQIDINTENHNNRLKEEHEKLLIEFNRIKADIGSITTSIALQQNHYKENQKINEELEDKINNNRIALQSTIQQNQEISEAAFNSYYNTLENSYREIEEVYDMRKSELEDEFESVKRELDKLKATRVAVHQAILKEKEIKENKDNYRLIPSSADLADSRKLEIIKRELNNPRIICMLIWQSYWQPLAKKQFPYILQAKTKCGIYKITNQITDECYIGQSLDCYRRWSDHCKCGLGIDTPPGNKLYKAMQEYGLENFTFELLEDCNPSHLDEKERFYIELYQADTFGYNSQKGNK